MVVHRLQHHDDADPFATQELQRGGATPHMPHRCASIAKNGFDTSMQNMEEEPSETRDLKRGASMPASMPQRKASIVQSHPKLHHANSFETPGFQPGGSLPLMPHRKMSIVAQSAATPPVAIPPPALQKRLGGETPKMPQRLCSITHVKLPDTSDIPPPPPPPLPGRLGGLTPKIPNRRGSALMQNEKDLVALSYHSAQL